MAALIFGSIGVIFSVLTAIVALCWLAKAVLEYVVEVNDLYGVFIEALEIRAKKRDI